MDALEFCLKTMRLAALVHKILVPGCANRNASRERSRIVREPQSQRSILQTETRKPKPIHRSSVANTHTHTPSKTRSHVHLLYQRHLPDHLRSLPIALLPLLYHTSQWRRIPRLALSICRHSLLVHPYTSRAQQEHQRRHKQQDQDTAEPARDEPSPHAALPSLCV